MNEGADRQIILIGYRCTGKTAIGKKLAVRLGLPFIDTDALVEEENGLTIREMVAEKGWECFREKEREAIRSLAGRCQSVVATGGGVVLDERNAAFLKNAGVIIWLAAGEDTICRRMRRDAATLAQRPPLSSGDLQTEIAATLAERTPFYRRLADFTVVTDAAGLEECAQRIEEFLTEHGLIRPL